jgi:hypothetical protein
MSTKERCKDCATYDRAGHNYCRLCGFHLMAGYSQYARLSEAYDPDEKFCGYCGGPKNNCPCESRIVQIFGS